MRIAFLLLLTSDLALLVNGILAIVYEFKNTFLVLIKKK